MGPARAGLCSLQNYSSGSEFTAHSVLFIQTCTDLVICQLAGVCQKRMMRSFLKMFPKICLQKVLLSKKDGKGIHHFLMAVRMVD